MGEQGTTLVETLVALALVGAIVVTFLSGLAATSKATIIVDEQATAESVARSQMEWVKKAAYVYDATAYSAASLPDGDEYIGYSVTVTAASLNTPDDGIQQITIEVQHFDKEVRRVEGYKVDR